MNNLVILISLTCHTRKYRGSANNECNRGFILTKKITVAFHILQSYDLHLIFQELERYTVFTRKSAYAQKSTPLELVHPFENQKLNEHLPRISAPLFPLKGRSFETDLLLISK